MIDLDNSFRFVFVEDSKVRTLNPVSNYYFKLDDLSINLLISLKWLKWAYFFMKSIKNGIDEIEDNNSLERIITKSIQDFRKNNLEYEKKIIIIDNEIVEDDDKFVFLVENFYSKSWFDENTKVHVKLKLNIGEYLLLTNSLFPTLVKVRRIYKNKCPIY